MGEGGDHEGGLVEGEGGLGAVHDLAETVEREHPVSRVATAPAGYVSGPCTPAPTPHDPRPAGRDHGRSGEVVTYRQLDERSNRLAHLLRGAGPAAGATTSPSCIENHPRFLEVLWAAQRAGLYYTAINSRLTAGEAAYIVNDCGARVFLTSAAKPRGGRGTGGRDARCRGPPHARRRRPTGYESYEDRGGRPTRRRPSPTSPRAPTCSTRSGTTGRPEGREAGAPRRPDRHAAGGAQRSASAVRLRAGDRSTSRPRPAVPRGPAALHHGRHRIGAHRRGDGALRPASVPRA